MPVECISHLYSFIMKSILKQIAEKTRQTGKAEAEAIKTEIANPATTK